MEGGGQVDGDDRVPLVRRKFFNFRDKLDAGVVDEDVHAAEVALGVAHHVLDLGGAAHVRGVVTHLDAAASARDLGLCAVHVTKTVGDDVGALRGQCLRDAESDPTGRASHQCRLAFEHVSLRRE
ncbi:hypothetical protein D3C72_1696740 [compost metagenome]